MEFYWQSVAALIAVVGPWKAAIAFAEETRPMSVSTRRMTGAYTVLIAAAVGVLFVLIGDPIIEFFHIDGGAFLIGSGILVVVFAIGMVISDDSHGGPPRANTQKSALRVATFPLSVPLVITPPGIASLIALGVFAELNDEALVAVVAAFLTVMAVNFVVFMIESQWANRINPAVWSVAGRVLGVLLVGMGVSFALEGLHELEILK